MFPSSSGSTNWSRCHRRWIEEKISGGKYESKNLSAVFYVKTWRVCCWSNMRWCSFNFHHLVSLNLQLSILVHPDKNQDDPDRAQQAFEGKFLTTNGLYHFTQIIKWPVLHLASLKHIKKVIWTCIFALAVDKAYKLLLDAEQKKRILDVIHAGKEYVEHMVSVQTFPHMLSLSSTTFQICSWCETHCCLPCCVPQQVKEKKKQLKKDGKLLDVEEDDPEVVRQSCKHIPDFSYI